MQGVVLETYGSGNGPDSRPDILHELKAAADRGVLFVNCTQCLYGEVVDSYATGKVCDHDGDGDGGGGGGGDGGGGAW